MPPVDVAAVNVSVLGSGVAVAVGAGVDVAGMVAEAVGLAGGDITGWVAVGGTDVAVGVAGGTVGVGVGGGNVAVGDGSGVFAKS